MSEPVPTRRENPEIPAGPGVTRREGAPDTGAHWTVHSLPAALAARLTDLTPMPTTGGEAQLLTVRDSAHPGEALVLKVYYPHVAPDQQVWARLGSIRSKHVVRVVETGKLTDDRFFELMEYVPDGSLRDAGAGSRVFAVDTITEMVGQLTDGLTVLHRLGITHRDLKPENVLVRRSGQATELVLTDFGLSRRLDTSAHFTTGARTSAYAAPEAWAGHVSPARDWWSLGVLVLELATGVQPFHGLDERMIQKAVTTKPVPVDGVTDARLKRLCAGLLVSDEANRWQGEQVRDWLAGGSPAVPDRRVPIDATEFEFNGKRFRDPAALAVEMAGNWRLAARRFGMTGSHTWTAFVTWLDQFNAPDQNPTGVVEERLDLLGRLEASKEKPNAKLVRLLANLNPRQPPIFRQVHIDVPKLREVAQRAQDGPAGKETDNAREVVNELWAGELLAVLAQFDGAHELADLGTRWSANVEQLRAAVATLKRDHPHLVAVFTANDTKAIPRAAMLEFTIDRTRGDDWVRELMSRTATLPLRIPWYDSILAWAGTDPVRAYSALHAFAAAQAEAQQVVMAAQAAEAARQAREQAWAAQERQRLAGSGDATRTAVASASVLTLLWLIVAVFAGETPALAMVALACGTHFTAEVVLAKKLGADYHPVYSLQHAMQVAMGRVGGQMRMSPRGWAIGIIVTFILVALVDWLAALAALAAILGHIFWAARRHADWTAVHEQRHRETMNQ